MQRREAQTLCDLCHRLYKLLRLTQDELLHLVPKAARVS